MEKNGDWLSLVPMSNVVLANVTPLPAGPFEVEASSPAILFIKSAALGLMVTLTVGGNLLVMLAVLATPCGGLLHRSPTHLLIANLAAADLLLGAAVLPLSAARELAGGAWQFGRALCAVWAAADVLCCTASILSLCGISVDRYIGVTRPLAYSGIMTKRRAGWLIAGIWVLALAISIGPPLGWRDTHIPIDQRTKLADGSSINEFDGTNDECNVNKQLDYVIFSVVGSFYAPMFIIVILYSQVYRAVVKRSNVLQMGCHIVTVTNCGDATLRVHVSSGGAASHQVQTQTSGAETVGESFSRNQHRPLLSRVQQASSRAAALCTSTKFRRQKKAAQTLAIVVGGFLICWLPFFIILPIDSACSSCGLGGTPFTLAFWLGYFNSCINPFIYACSSQELRRAFRAVLCGRRSRDSRQDQEARRVRHKLVTQGLEATIPLQTFN